ncbi:hypothetical protein [uncultured Methylobacterium sp.]|uniref:hypothetical protein n=1 Tax=uncultured Methylobacterium sp. TaxID=157278 RepID=UPI00258792A6|nr:hypothetical protein [uncultured Methylobacterium sp.]
MSKRSSSSIPAWLRRRGYSPRAMVAIAAAIRRTGRSRDAEATERACLIIPFPKRPLSSAPSAAADEGGLLQVGA